MPIKQPQLDQIELPEPPVLLSRLPVEAMRDCNPIPQPPSISVLDEKQQPRALLEYYTTLLGGYADCSLRHKKLKEWIENEHKQSNTESN